MKQIALFTTLALLALPALPAAAATKSVDRSVKASPDAEVSIELVAGTVRVVGWNKDEVRVSGTLNDKWETLEMDGVGDDISIEISLPEGRHKNMELDADLEISVPVGARLSFETVSAPLSVEGLSGSVRVESISGTIDISVGLRKLAVESISGTVQIAADSRLESVDVASISGQVEMRGEFAAGGDYSLSSISGAITLRVPSGSSADYEIDTFSGSISNDFGPKPKRAEHLPSLSLSFSVGSGSAEVAIESVSGSIRLLED